jgi:hypothetical protein
VIRREDDSPSGRGEGRIDIDVGMLTTKDLQPPLAYGHRATPSAGSCETAWFMWEHWNSDTARRQKAGGLAALRSFSAPMIGLLIAGRGVDYR